MLKHRFIARLNSLKELHSLVEERKASFSSYLNDNLRTTIEDCEDEISELQIFEKPIIIESLDKPNKFYLKNQDSQNMSPKLKENSGENNNVSEMLNELRQGNNLAKFLESHGLSTSSISLPQLKDAFDQFLSKQTEKKKEISKWEEQLNNLRELTDDKKLEKWLESVGVQPSQVSLPLVKAEIKRFFNAPEELKNPVAPTIAEPVWGKRNDKISASNISLEKSKSSLTEKSEEISSDVEFIPEVFKNRKIHGRAEPLENYRGRSLIYHEDNLVRKIWDEFKEMSPAKQVAVVVGITVVTAAVGFVSWRVLIMMFPRVLSFNHYWSEVLAQWFIQRNDTAFQLLVLHSEQAKPLSTAWANQYILWKYI